MGPGGAEKKGKKQTADQVSPGQWEEWTSFYSEDRKSWYKCCWCWSSPKASPVNLNYTVSLFFRENVSFIFFESVSRFSFQKIANLTLGKANSCRYCTKACIVIRLLQLESNLTPIFSTGGTFCQGCWMIVIKHYRIFLPDLDSKHI
jgi:hypothetical protein